MFCVGVEAVYLAAVTYFYPFDILLTIFIKLYIINLITDDKTDDVTCNKAKKS